MNTFRVNLFGGLSIESKHKALVIYFGTSRIIIIFKNCPVEHVVIFLYENPLHVELCCRLSHWPIKNLFFLCYASISDHHKIFSEKQRCVRWNVHSYELINTISFLPLHSWLWFIRYTVPTCWNVDVLHVRLLVMLFNTIFLSIMR